MYHTVLDIGSSAIKALVAETKRDGGLSIIGVMKTPSAGTRRGEIAALDEATHALHPLIDELRAVHKTAPKHLVVNINGTHVKLQTSRGIVAVSRADNEIYDDDIERVIKASQALNIGPNRMILHTLTKEFVVDGITGILDPLGMTGNRLEVESSIIDAFKATVANVKKCVEGAGGHTGTMIYGPLAACRGVATKTQKELGVAVIDIGFGTTGMAVYEENQLLAATVFPVGSANITNDLAIGLRSSIKAAERIKLAFGSALAREVAPREKIELHEVDASLDASVSRKFISEIIEVRLAEIFELVNNELKLLGKAAKLPAGALLTGGGAKMPGIVELAKRELKLPVHIGTPSIEAWDAGQEIAPQVEDPEFAVAAGLLAWASDEPRSDRGWLGDERGRLQSFLKRFLP